MPRPTILVAKLPSPVRRREFVLAIATASASFCILIFAEILPKVSERVLPNVSRWQQHCAQAADSRDYPLMWIINVIVRAILRIFGMKPVAEGAQQLSMAEMRTLVLGGRRIYSEETPDIMVNLFDLETHDGRRHDDAARADWKAWTSATRSIISAAAWPPRHHTAWWFMKATCRM